VEQLGEPAVQRLEPLGGLGLLLRLIARGGELLLEQPACLVAIRVEGRLRGEGGAQRRGSDAQPHPDPLGSAGGASRSAAGSVPAGGTKGSGSAGSKRVVERRTSMKRTNSRSSPSRRIRAST